MRKVLVTGANGFIGRALCERMLAEGWQVLGVFRSSNNLANLPDGVDAVAVTSIDSDTDWSNALVGVDTIIHLASRVHVINDTVADPSMAFRRVNVNGTKRLSRMAASANVKRFFYMSSVKVNGDGRSTPYTEDDTHNPQDLYGYSKSEAEEVVVKVSSETGLETVIIRPPLVYGPGVKANFLRLVEMVNRGVPLPFASVKNRRSLIYLGNLIDAVVTCVTHPQAVGRTYLVSDSEDVSTPELIRRLGSALGRPARLFPFPPLLIRLAGRLLGKSEAVERLLGSLTVDCKKIRSELDWKAPYNMEQGLFETAKWYKERGREVQSTDYADPPTTARHKRASFTD